MKIHPDLLQKPAVFITLKAPGLSVATQAGLRVDLKGKIVSVNDGVVELRVENRFFRVAEEDIVMIGYESQVIG